MKSVRNLLRASSACAWFAVSMVVSPAAHASAVEQFKAFVANTRSAQGEFTQQQIKLVDGKPKVSKTASGSYVFARPGKFIWTYQKPYAQTLQADGVKLYIYDKDLNQVTIKELGNALGASPAAILFGSANASEIEKSFTLKEAGTKQGMEWLDAIAKSSDSQFEHIGIGMKAGVPYALELRDNFGQISLVTLTSLEKNPVLKNEQFNFVIPAGADVFRP
ncbi:outer membrane lipoprotein chaperone LolA [Undibacterium sp. CCC2.1]|uniref:outer membrane lipoprotein chaperone LolA n=1 Tax=unclassified Undibacterium TaxID=2630295 RepID=UPI002AC9F0CB|nr:MULTISPECIES: outer membrane lipoprotein chaperone LolA [unclassified Undibacterium]MEB0140360.1 outer membrane lipoprotein chaperone LolA [Undibacterium sp. CCC2.1]MEB0173395.1 outer membrane lipoprotein chaperone LolA [Undibacterium sp. CCC1.1]MEB0176792.1 outer membrane lipoprotein chaperone LolA [Undibacterium sp. CCC3.4]MEB0216551.1 outer membrane lipoprotein chaperone LolA [Undibacterium sp. 5I2]WPX43387.1 outer membrane lipoprotein chaperone LolA [Undibacterium sp. CCC3.4]